MLRPIITPARAERAWRLSQVHSHRTVCALTGISSSALSELKRRGWRSAQRGFRPVPKDWGLVAPELTSTQLQRHYRAGPSTIKRWFREKPVARPRSGPPAFAIPDDLAATLSRLGHVATARHFGVSSALVLKWRKRLHLDAKGQSTLGWEARYRAHVAAEAHP